MNANRGSELSANHAEPRRTKSDYSEIKGDLLQAEERRQAKEAHDRELIAAAAKCNGIKCQRAEDVVECLDENLTEIKTPVLNDFLSGRGWSYITVTCQLEERGWKLDPATRTMRKVEAGA